MKEKLLYSQRDLKRSIHETNARKDDFSTLEADGANAERVEVRNVVKNESFSMSEGHDIISVLSGSDIEFDNEGEEEDDNSWKVSKLKAGFSLRGEKHIKLKEKTFTCELCDRSFAHAGSLRTHHLIHTGERPYCCNICGKKFRVSSHLKDHHVIHTGMRPYSCQVCGRTFTQAGNLRRHHLIHKKHHFL